MNRELIFEHNGGRLEVDEKTHRLYWNGERIAIDTLRLTFWQTAGAAITVVSAFTVAAMTVVQYFRPCPGI